LLALSNRTRLDISSADAWRLDKLQRTKQAKRIKNLRHLGPPT
jgi:hypothetical protein